MILVEDFSTDSWKSLFSTFGRFYEGDEIDVIDGKLRITCAAGTQGRYQWALLNQPLSNFKLEITLTDYQFPEAKFLVEGEVFAGIMVADRRINFTNARFIGVFQNGSEVALRIYDFQDDTMIGTPYELPELPITFRVEKYGQTVFFYLVDGDEKTLIQRFDDFPEGPCYFSPWMLNVIEAETWAEYADLEVEYSSIMGDYLWSIMPLWMKKYPLQIAADGDLAMTPNGLISLLQDAADALDEGGLSAFFGKPFTPAEEARMAKQIKSILAGDGLSPRLVPGKSTVTITETSTGQFQSNIALSVQSGDELLEWNLVYQFGIDSVTGLYENPSAPIRTTTPVGPDGYTDPALGRDLLLDRDNPMESEDWSQLPQWHIIQAFGHELDLAMLFLVEARDNFSITNADEGALADMAPLRDLLIPEIYTMTESGLRFLLGDTFQSKQLDGTVLGLKTLCVYLGFDVTIVEGWRTDFYTTMETNGIILDDLGVDRLRWAEIHVILTPSDGDVSRSFQEFHQKILRRQRAGRRICYHFPSDEIDWDEFDWRSGNPYWITCFADKEGG